MKDRLKKVVMDPETGFIEEPASPPERMQNYERHKEWMDMFSEAFSNGNNVSNETTLTLDATHISNLGGAHTFLNISYDEQIPLVRFRPSSSGRNNISCRKTFPQAWPIFAVCLYLRYRQGKYIGVFTAHLLTTVSTALPLDRGVQRWLTRKYARLVRSEFQDYRQYHQESYQFSCGK
jgi:hypothetical protein